MSDQPCDHATIDFSTPSHDVYAHYGSHFSCPIQFAMNLLRRKWAVQLIYALSVSSQPVRFNQLERALAPITQKELTKRLRELESAGIVERTVHPEVPSRVDYRLTEQGRALMPSLDSLTQWGAKYREAAAIT